MAGRGEVVQGERQAGSPRSWEPLEAFMQEGTASEPRRRERWFQDKRKRVSALNTPSSGISGYSHSGSRRRGQGQGHRERTLREGAARPLCQRTWDTRAHAPRGHAWAGSLGGVEIHRITCDSRFSVVLL